MGKITVEIKKSTFGKPLHNFDHPKGTYLQNLQKRIFKFNITFYSFGYVTLEKLLEQIAPLNWGFFLKSQHFSLVPQPRDGSGQNPTRGCFAQLDPTQAIFWRTQANP